MASQNWALSFKKIGMVQTWTVCFKTIQWPFLLFFAQVYADQNYVLVIFKQDREWSKK